MYKVELWRPEIFFYNFSFKVLYQFTSCEKITHEKSYFNILNGNQEIGDSKFLLFLKLHDYLSFLVEANLQVNM
jgi:hypothetical protein